MGVTKQGPFDLPETAISGWLHGCKSARSTKLGRAAYLLNGMDVTQTTAWTVPDHRLSAWHFA